MMMTSFYAWKTVACWAPEAVGLILWNDTEATLKSAEATLDAGGVIYLLVECLGSAGWDWMVWDKNGQIIPRYGHAQTVAAAKYQAEFVLGEINAVLLEGGCG